MKTCSTCQHDKSLDDYYNYKKSSDGKQPRCKSCDKLARNAYRARHLEKYQVRARDTQLKMKYGITLEEYETILSKQGGACACCGATENTARYGLNKSHSFAVDHCHSTGKVRGLLCNQCNRGIGMLGDTLEGVQKAVNYLQRV